ncbi:hypothetical protein OH76DRAFT_1478552 [Lentinus brumalis]|uniref:HNH nuclease domain-containing protein n=1 Tax=Lentinus brumalis TaxID=2498619 RepID=A0A371DRB5_9APHY|nr:hypothetical protein OH76DRAFT_1478552 [Polyporus brumalis]
MGLEITHIFKDLRSLFRNKEQSYSTTLDLLQRFCELSPQRWPTERVDAPDNLFILEPSTQIAWDTFRCALVPDEIINHYRLMNYLPYKFTGFQVADDVMFADHSKEWTDDETAVVPLLNAELLRARAAITGVLNRSGILNVLDSIKKSCHSAPDGDGESLLRFLEGCGALVGG